MVENFLLGLNHILTFQGLAICFVGAVLSTMVGILPGLNAGTAVVMLLPFAKEMPLEYALAFILSISYGCQYSGSTGAILAGVPGESSSAVSVINGRFMAKQGRAWEAMYGASIASFVGGMISLLFMVILVAAMAGKPSMSPIFYISISLAALAMFLGFNKKSFNNTLVAILIGFVLTLCVSGGKLRQDSLPILFGGVDISVLAIAFFGIAEALTSINGGRSIASITDRWQTNQIVPKLKSILPSSIRGGLIGLINIFPGIGYLTLTTASYGAEKALSKVDDFDGEISGLVGPESANNSAAQCGTLSLLVFGMPTGAVTSVMASMIAANGIDVTPALSVEQPLIVWTTVASILVINIFLLFMNMPNVNIWKWLFSVSARNLNYLILAVCAVSAITMTTPLGFIVTIVLSAIGILIKKTTVPISSVFIGSVMGFLLEESILKAIQ